MRLEIGAATSTGGRHLPSQKTIPKRTQTLATPSKRGGKGKGTLSSSSLSSSSSFSFPVGEGNQDRFFLYSTTTPHVEHFLSLSSSMSPSCLIACGILDGHGTKGSEASEVARLTFLRALQSTEATGKLLSSAPAFLKSSFEDAHRRILETYTVSDTNIDYGTTATFLLFQFSSSPFDFPHFTLTTAHAGDSKAILALDSAEEEVVEGEKEHKTLGGGRRGRTEEFEVVRLTSPLHLARGESGKRTAGSVVGVGGGKTTGGMDERERQRLERDFGGKYKILEEGYLQPVHGFWWRQQLQLVRSLGHRHLQEFGVIPQPSIDVRTSEESIRGEGESSIGRRGRERAIIAASDGLWDVVEEEEAIRVVLRRKKEEEGTEEAARQIANELVELAKSRTKTPEDSDDVTVIVVLFLDEKEIEMRHKITKES